MVGEPVVGILIIYLFKFLNLEFLKFENNFFLRIVRSVALRGCLFVKRENLYDLQIFIFSKEFTGKNKINN